VVLDLGMPGVDGYETARALRAATGGADVVLIAVTGWGQPDDYVRSKAAGFDYHLVKPVGADSLVELLTSLPVRQELIA
jgi:two-component system CheB/CheR fusion protein